jgi:hypothetical protein
MRVALAEDDLPIQQAIIDWLKLPSTQRRYDQDAWDFIAEHLETYDCKRLKHNHGILFSAIIRYQGRIGEPLALTPPVAGMRLEAVGVRSAEPRAVNSSRPDSSRSISRKRITPLDRSSLTIG